MKMIIKLVKPIRFHLVDPSFIKRAFIFLTHVILVHRATCLFTSSMCARALQRCDRYWCAFSVRSKMTEAVPLPEGACPFDHQVAGHVHGNKKTKLGLLKHSDGSVLKPIIPDDERTVRELKFYERVFHSKEPLSELRVLRDLIPGYRGTWATVVDGEKVEYMKLEDMTASFKHPSILDVKIGAQTYDPFASPDKVALEEGKYPWTRQLGFRILGMRVYDVVRQQYTNFGKSYGLRQTPDTVVDAFRTFLDTQRDVVSATAVLSEVLSELRQIERWFMTQRIFAFYSSSLLVVYESERSEAPSEPAEDFETPPQCVIKMIDFAHTYEVDKEDHNYLFGLRSLMGVLEQVV